MRMMNSLPLLLVLALAAHSYAAEEQADTKQDVYESPDAAFKALLDGIGSNSDEKLLDVLGHNQKELVVQTDKEASKEMRKKVDALAKEFMKIDTTGDKATASFGYRGWPFPIPLVKSDKGWRFDTAAGREEILNRRIGRNELKTIQFMNSFCDAQRAYVTADRTGDKALKYAQKLISTKGKKDGLFWTMENTSTDNNSPLAQYIDEDRDFVDGDGTDIPYQGYYFKVLTKQGAAAPNGKYSYVINGNMIAGFAMVGWPADYGASGIMTFIVSQDGTVFQKDLGDDTAKNAGAMDEFNPDAAAGWVDVNAPAAADKPEEKPGEKASDKPSERSTDKPADKPAVK